jgi:hypothetical protein
VLALARLSYLWDTLSWPCSLSELASQIPNQGEQARILYEVGEIIDATPA